MENKRTIYDTLNKGINNVLHTMSGVGTETHIKIVDNIISFIGLAGGVGTSTIVANIACLAEKLGLTVLVIDMNIMYPAQNLLFRLERDTKDKDLVDYLQGNCTIGEAIKSKTKKSNISVLASYRRQLIDYINCDNEVASKNLEHILGKIKYKFDLILIDCPLLIPNDPLSAVLYASDTFYVVMDESVGCVANYDIFIKSLHSLGINTNRIKAIMNKKTSVYYPKSTFKALGLNLIGTLPFDIALIESSLQGHIFVDKGASFSENSKKYAKEITKIFEFILEQGGYNREITRLNYSKDSTKSINVGGEDDLGGSN